MLAHSRSRVQAKEAADYLVKEMLPAFAEELVVVATLCS
jgi:hypothetical protein